MPTVVDDKPKTTGSAQVSLTPMYKVLLHNDDVNNVYHVVCTLIQVFGWNVEKASSVMWEAHRSGIALCTVEPLEQAEFHQEQLHSAGLTATIEPA